MEREERRLDRERDHEPEEQPLRARRTHARHVERPLLEPEDDDRRQHQQRADDGVDDERDRRLHPVAAAPDADQDVERDQHRLEEGVEEQQVLRGEDADDRAGQQQHQCEVGARPVAADPPAVDRARRHHDHRHPDEPEGEAVLADVPAHLQVGEPRRTLVELQRRGAEVELAHRGDPHGDLDERDERGERAEPVARERRDRDQQRAGEREDDQGSRQPVHQRTARKTTVRTARPPASASA